MAVPVLKPPLGWLVQPDCSASDLASAEGVAAVDDVHMAAVPVCCSVCACVVHAISQGSSQRTQRVVGAVQLVWAANNDATGCISNSV